jgi:predicted RNA-binding Zn-ribbon protein involved in translation (DUF1610 family)
MEGTTFICPSCGGKLTYDAKERMLICVSCNNTYTAKDLMQIDKSIDDTEGIEADYFKNEDNTTEYTCTSCGGAIIVEDSIASSVCPFCGNNVLLKNSLVGELRPKYIVPFLNSKDKIEKIKHHYLNKNPFLPFGFKEAVNKARVNDLYIPLYVLRGKVAFDFLSVGKTRMNNYVLEKNQFDFTPKTSFGTIQFHHFPLEALIPNYDNIIQAIGPFDLKNIKQFNTPYLAGHMAKRLELSFRGLKSKAVLAVEEEMSKILKNPVTLKRLYMENGELRREANEGEILFTENIRVTQIKASYTFYPTWFIESTFKGKKYSIIINDQNGSISGKIPLSKTKVKLFGIFFFILFEQIIYWLLFLINKNWIASLIGSIFIGMIITIIVMVYLYTSNYSYKKPTENYIVPSSFNIGNKREERVKEEKAKTIKSLGEQMLDLNIEIMNKKKSLNPKDSLSLREYQILLEKYQGILDIYAEQYKTMYIIEEENALSYSKEELEDAIRFTLADKSACDGRLRTGKITKEYYDILIDFDDKKLKLYQDRLKSLTE